jgi:DNA-binding GntR family transcriptional regulator
VKTSEAVAEHMVELLFAGAMRSGERIDLDAVAASLGVSRAPVREALLQLERDGLVTLEYHRGAYVAPFEPATVEEAFDLYAMLSGRTSGRVAERRDQSIVAELRAVFETIGTTSDGPTFERAAREFRRVVNLSVAGPHMRALLRSFSGLVPAGSRLVLDRSMDDERRYIRRELTAIEDGDPDGATGAVTEHIHLLGQQVVAALAERGVFDAERAPERS